MAESTTTAIIVKERAAPFEVGQSPLRAVRDNDIEIDVLFCGVCHTDLHYVTDDWDLSHYPLVPGHEVVGRVASIGKDVSKLKVGDHVGVGYIVWSCRECEDCKRGLENYCDKAVTTLAGVMPDGEITKGGWARKCICPEEFCVKIDESIDPAKAAPLLCAGLTVFSPMERWGLLKGGYDVGVIGMGGLGHLAVMFLKAMGNRVTVFDIFPDRAETAKVLGAVKFVNSKDADAMAREERSLNFLFDTAAGGKKMEPFFLLLKTEGMIVNIGLPPKGYKIEVAPSILSFKGRGIAGTLTGSVKATQDMFDFCATHKIEPWTEIIKVEELTEGIARMLAGKIRFRMVLDIDKTLNEDTVIRHVEPERHF